MAADGFHGTYGGPYCPVATSVLIFSLTAREPPSLLDSAVAGQPRAGITEDDSFEWVVLTSP